MGCESSNTPPATQPSAAPIPKKESGGKSKEEAKTQGEEDTTSLTFDESKIDKTASNYVEDSKLDRPNTALLKHKRSGSFVIVKKFDCEGEGDILTKVSELIQLRHRHIVCYLWGNNVSTSLNVFIEHCEGGSLKKLIGNRERDSRPFTEEELRRLLLHMALGLSFIHSHRIIHRHMRPTNVLLSADNVAKIADFGEGAILKSGLTQRHTRVGPELYMAPEMMHDVPHSFPVDVWALGVTLHEMSTYRVPFAKVTAIPTTDDSDFLPLNEQYSDGLRQLAKNLLIVTAEKRHESAAIVEIVRKM